jgi:uncharacterized protein YdeI (YjbR/CyaY-like superfamily)
MGTKNKRVDSYISKSADYAKPILKHIRELVHKSCPDVTETIKWGFPSFDYKGPMCSMASFKQHCAFGFWKTSIMKDPNKIFNRGEKTAMGTFGPIKGINDLPKDKILIEYIKQAVKFNEEGVKLPAKTKPKQQKELIIPDYFTKALNKSKKALNTFVNFSPSKKREYVEWITEAKTDETRNKRLGTAVEWISEGKSRNWKYERK